MLGCVLITLFWSFAIHGQAVHTRQHAVHMTPLEVNDIIIGNAAELRRPDSLYMVEVRTQGTGTRWFYGCYCCFYCVLLVGVLVILWRYR